MQCSSKDASIFCQPAAKSGQLFSGSSGDSRIRFCGRRPLAEGQDCRSAEESKVTELPLTSAPSSIGQPALLSQRALRPGVVVGGDYVISERLGFGTSSIVYKCHRLSSPQTTLALKVLRSSDDPTAPSRFRRGFVSAYQLCHPNVIRPEEYINDKGLTAYVMEYVDGSDLGELLKDGRQLSIAETLDYCGQILSGLDAVHQAGIVHRDVKPDNVLLGSAGEIKITDFGIALPISASRLTKDGEILGSIDYVSPEYLESGKVDLRADIYAVGLLAYQMLCGEFPFQRCASLVESLTHRLSSTPKPLLHYRGDIPLELHNLVFRALQRQPDRRFQSALQMLEELRVFRRSLAPEIESTLILEPSLLKL